MGLLMSLMGKSLPTNQMLNLVMGTLYRKFFEKEIIGFDDFHVAILDIFSTLNAALPGKHYDVPPAKLVQEVFMIWEEVTESEKKRLFVEFMIRSVTMTKFADSALVTGLVTPPAAMAAKRATETLPQLKIIKSIPDVIFVPSATVLALVSVKLSKNIFF